MKLFKNLFKTKTEILQENINKQALIEKERQELHKERTTINRLKILKEQMISENDPTLFNPLDPQMKGSYELGEAYRECERVWESLISPEYCVPVHFFNLYEPENILTITLLEDRYEYSEQLKICIVDIDHNTFLLVQDDLRDEVLDYMEENDMTVDNFDKKKMQYHLQKFVLKYQKEHEAMIEEIKKSI